MGVSHTPGSTTGHRSRQAPFSVAAFVLIVAMAIPMLVPVPSGLAPAEAADDPESVAAFTNRLDVQLPEIMDDYDVPGVAVALVEDAEVVRSGAYGLADIEAVRPMTVDTVMRVESISKSVTAWGVMKLVEQGLLDLDDPIGSHLGDWTLPESDFARDDLTIRRLLSQTGGMPLGIIDVHYPPTGEIPALEDSLRDQAHLVREPGTRFEYSNVGFNLLQLVIERVTGEDFADYMQREVLSPLGMNESSYRWIPDWSPPVPDGHTLDGTPVPVYVYPEAGAGGLFATVGDIARFVAASTTGPLSPGRMVLDSDSIRLLHSPATETAGIYRFVSGSYGLGHFVESLSTGERAVWHGGQGDGWMTHFHAVPEAGDGIVILTNSSRSWPLIARVLQEWTDWNGLGPVGMEIIIKADNYLRVGLAVLTLVLIWQIWRIGFGLLGRRRSFDPLSPRARVRRSLLTGLAVTLVAVLVWSAAQEYLFVTAIFPATTSWLLWVIAGAAVVLATSAAMPPATGRPDSGSDPGAGLRRPRARPRHEPGRRRYRLGPGLRDRGDGG
jgi:CubicO group peptidase (beta-lactamase class C family)